MAIRNVRCGVKRQVDPFATSEQPEQRPGQSSMTWPPLRLTERRVANELEDIAEALLGMHEERSAGESRRRSRTCG